MPAPWKDQDQAQELLNKGLISPDQYASVYGSDLMQSPPAPIETQPAEIPVEQQVLPSPELQPAPEAPVEPHPQPSALSSIPAVDPATAQTMLTTAPKTQPHQVDPEENLGGVNALALGQKLPMEAVTQAAPQTVPTSSLVTPVSAGVEGQQQPNPLRQQFDEQMHPYEMQRDAIDFSQRVGEAKAAEESSYQRRMQGDSNKRLEKDLKTDQEGRNYYDEQSRKLEEENQKVASQKIDPNHYWADKTTNQKIMTGIGLFFGAIGAGKTGVNLAAKTIENAIERDIQTQKDNLSNQKDVLNRSYNILNSSYDRFKDASLARASARVQAYTIAQNGLSAIASKYKGQEIQANAMNLYAELEAKKVAAKQQFLSTVQQKAMMQGLSRGMSIDPSLLPEETRERFVAGYGLSYTKDGKKIADEAAITFKQSDTTIDSLIKVSKEIGIAGKMSPEILSRVKTDVTTLIAGLRKDIVGPGAVNESEWKLLHDIVADPTELIRYKPAQVQLEQLKLRLGQKKDAIMGQHIIGYQPLSKKFDEQPVKVLGGPNGSL